MKQNKIITIYDIDKQNNKLFSLEKRLQFLINQHIVLKEKFKKIMIEYKESCEILEKKEKEKKDAISFKNEYAKSQELQKQKQNLHLRLGKFRAEHLSIKQTLEEYEKEKKKLEMKYERLLNQYNELKNKEEKTDYYINEKKIEKKGLQDYLEGKIFEEAKFRTFFEEGIKQTKKNYVPPAINQNHFPDFHNLSNVIGSDRDEEEEDKIEQKEINDNYFGNINEFKEQNIGKDNENQNLYEELN